MVLTLLVLKMLFINIPARKQSKTLLTIDEQGSKITRNSVLVSGNFVSTFVDSINIFDCRLYSVINACIIVSFPLGARGCFMICDWVISWSYSLYGKGSKI